MLIRRNSLCNGASTVLVKPIFAQVEDLEVFVFLDHFSNHDCLLELQEIVREIELDKVKYLYGLDGPTQICGPLVIDSQLAKVAMIWQQTIPHLRPY